MLYTVSYDISENKIRNKVVMKCKNYGLVRVQKSIFMGELTKNKAEMLSLEIKNFAFQDSDKIFIFPSCNSCFDGKQVVGLLNEGRLRDKDFIIIQNKNEGQINSRWFYEL